MDLEKAIEFLVESQANHEAHLQGIDAQLKAIRSVIQGGLKVVTKYRTETNRRFDALLDAQIRTEEHLARLASGQAQMANGQSQFADAQARTEEKLARLADAQGRTEQELRALIDSLKHPKNGHGE
jgi:hypothetical protein